MSHSSPVEITKIHHFILQCFSLEEINTLCFILGLSHDDLPGEGRDAKARELITYCQRHGWLPALLKALHQERPDQFGQAGFTLADGDKIVAPFHARFCQESPYPIAVACQSFNHVREGEQYTDKFVYLDRLLRNLVRYLATIALTQYWRDQPDTAYLRTLLAEFTRPNLMGMLNILNGINEVYSRVSTSPRLSTLLYESYNAPVAGNSAIANAYEFVIKELGALVQPVPHDTVLNLRIFLAQLLHYRQQKWEHQPGELDEKTRQKLLPLLQPALQQLLESLPFITNYPLNYIHRVDQAGEEWIYTVFGFKGYGDEPQPRPLLHETSHQPNYVARRLYLCDANDKPLLNLHPLLIAYHHPTALRLFFLEHHRDNEEICYHHCGSSERFFPPAHFKSLREELFQAAAQAADNDPVQQLTKAELEIEAAERNIPDPDKAPLPFLLARLSDESRQAVCLALGEAIRLGNFWLGVEFLLMGLSRQPQGVMAELLALCQIAEGDFRGALRGMVPVRGKAWRQQRQLEALGEQAWSSLTEIDPTTLVEQIKAGQTPTAAATPRLMIILREASTLAGQEKISPTHLLAATLKQPYSPAVSLLLGMGAEAGQDPRALIALVDRRLNGQTPEADIAKPTPERKNPREKAGSRPRAGQDILSQVGRDLTELAQQGQLRPVIGEGAHKAMVQISHILQQTQANNPILLGDPGVGKTAIVEGLAWRIALGEQHDQPVAAQLAGWRIVELSAATLLAGTPHRGELEEKLQQLLKEVHQAKRQTIIFIDEIHTLLGGRAEGGLGSIAEALKPALARGEFPCIGATTVAEYRRYIEADPALARRFTPVWLEEPTEKEAIAIASEVARQHLGPAHNVLYPDETIQEAVALASRYLHDEFLPGKAIKLLDQAGPRVMLGGSLRGQSPEQRTPGIKGAVTVETIRQIVAERTGIPLMHLEQDEAQRLLQLEIRLQQHVVGQDEALNQVAKVIRRARAGLSHPDKPLGVFLFAGPTGVGKTELALALAEFLFAEKEALLRLDMSEFMEKHTVSRLTGAPPGYVGYAEEGQLTGHLRRRPYSVILLDEMEKAHPEVQNLFLQLFDAGRLTDARGRRADGRNALFIMTTNLGAKEAMGLTQQRQSYRDKLQIAIEDHFTPEFLGRIDRILYFEPLNDQILLAIFDKLFAETTARFAAMGIEIHVSPEYKRFICQEFADVRRGARDLQRAIEDVIVTPLSDLKLEGKLQVGKAYQVQKDGIVDLEAMAEPQAEAEALPKTVSAPLADKAPPGPVENLRLDPRERHNRERVWPLLQALQTELGSHSLTLTLTEGAWEALCSPFFVKQAGEVKDAAADFERFVAEPLRRQIAEGVFKAGDTIELFRNMQAELDLRKVEGGNG